MIDEIQRAPETCEAVVGHELIDRVVAGGYPEALARSRWNRRRDWYLDYVEAIVQRDVRDTAQFEKLPSMPKLLRVLAQHSGQLVNHSGFGAQLGMNHLTTRKYTGVFESLYLLRSLQPWYSNALKRLTKTPKLHFLDSGLLAALRDVSPNRLRKDRALLGPLLETFVLAELLKLASWSQDRYDFSHFRDKERHEVDIVIEDRRGRVVGIEVKASATVSPRDFGGLRRLSDACGDRFVLGLVLHDHERVVPFGERLLAAPVSALWSGRSTWS